MKRRNYYETWDDLKKEHPEVAKDKELEPLYLSQILSKTNVVLGDKTFGHSYRNPLGEFYVEIDERYNFNKDFYNVYEDQIDYEIRKYIPAYTIRAIKNATYETSGLASVLVKFNDPKYNYQTSINGSVPINEVRNYFVGRMFDRGSYPKENFQRVIDIEYFPANDIKEIYNQALGYHYEVFFEYLPLRQKDISKNANDDKIFVQEFKIGNWNLILNDVDVYSKQQKEIATDYETEFIDTPIGLGMVLTTSIDRLKNAKRNFKNLKNEVRNILTDYRIEARNEFLNAETEREKDQWLDDINFIYDLLKQPIKLDLKYDYEIWKKGSVVFALEEEEELMEFVELVNSQNIRKSLAESMIKNPTSKFKRGGNISEENYQMSLSDANTISHHSKELLSALKKSKNIPAWVVAKLHQSSTTLSDITHYLEGTKFATGGSTPELAYKIGTPLKMKYSDDDYQLVSFSDHGYTVAKKVNGELVEYKSYPYNIIEHGIFTKA